MFKKLFILIVLIISLADLYSQTFYKANVLAGYAYNNNIRLNNKNVYDSRGAAFTISGLAEIPISSHLFIETGVSGKMVLSKGIVSSSHYSSKTLRLSVPVLLGKKINNKISILSGAAVQNNEDILDFHTRKNNNLRYDLLLKADYKLNSKWNLLKSVNYNIKLPDVYLINDPKISFMIGVSYSINKKENE